MSPGANMKNPQVGWEVVIEKEPTNPIGVCLVAVYLRLHAFVSQLAMTFTWYFLECSTKHLAKSEAAPSMKVTPCGTLAAKPPDKSSSARTVIPKSRQCLAIWWRSALPRLLGDERGMTLPGVLGLQFVCPTSSFISKTWRPKIRLWFISSQDQYDVPWLTSVSQMLCSMWSLHHVGFILNGLNPKTMLIE